MSKIKPQGEKNGGSYKVGPLNVQASSFKLHLEQQYLRKQYGTSTNISSCRSAALIDSLGIILLTPPQKCSGAVEMVVVKNSKLESKKLASTTLELR